MAFGAAAEGGVEKAVEVEDVATTGVVAGAAAEGVVDEGQGAEVEGGVEDFLGWSRPRRTGLPFPVGGGGRLCGRPRPPQGLAGVDESLSSCAFEMKW